MFPNIIYTFERININPAYYAYAISLTSFRRIVCPSTMKINKSRVKWLKNIISLK